MKKILAATLAFSLLSAQTVFAQELWQEAVSSTASDVWDGSADTAWYQVGQTVFTLNTPQQLAGMAQIVNHGDTLEGKKIILGNDLYMNEKNSDSHHWTPIASISAGKSFEGTFDGQGHSIYNICSEEEGGLFGTIGEKGIVKAVRTSQGKLSYASIAYENQGWILFCENDSEIFGIGNNSYSAGICCINQGLIYGCGNTGKVSGSSAGGITSQNSTNSATIDSCWNQGEIYGEGFCAAGIAASNYGWIYDCCNTGSIKGESRSKAGIAGENIEASSGGQNIYNCYNAGEIKANIEYYKNDTICADGKSGCLKNVYSLPSEQNHYAEEITAEEMKTSGAVTKLQGQNVISKWCLDKDHLNRGYIIPTARQDMKDGVYKMLPDVWDPVTEVSIDLSEGTYKFHAFSAAYYGIRAAEADYSSDSDLLSVTPDGMITLLKSGTAVVRVTFEETEHAKKEGFDVNVTITGTARMPGDVNGDKEVNVFDLMQCLNHVSGKNLLTGNAFATADIDGSGEVNLFDLMKILNHIARGSAL